MSSNTHRNPALDGLRGLAAAVVLLHHALLVVPSLAAPYYGFPAGSGWPKLVVSTPFHLLWAGTEAVFLFFVLSGFVLVLAVRSPRFAWSHYVPSRLVRLYVPVVAAVALAFVSIQLFSRSGSAEGLWLAGRPADYSAGALAHDVTLVGGVSGRVSPLWSLQWEVIFSLLLPLFIVAARWLSPMLFGWACFGLSTLAHVVVTSSASIGHSTVAFGAMYLPMFGIGVALAESWDGVAARCDRVIPSTSRRWWGIVSLGCLASINHWLLVDLLPASVDRVISLPLSLGGVTLVMIAAMRWSTLRDLLSNRLFQWLGLISFSLYLVHEPIVIAGAVLIDDPLAAAAVTLPLSLLVAWCFSRSVERPAHRLARRFKTAGAGMPRRMTIAPLGE